MFHFQDEIDFYWRHSHSLSRVLLCDTAGSDRELALCEHLALVRSVSFQMCKRLDLDEPGRRAVTRLILFTFHFYYVGIYTTDRIRTACVLEPSARSPIGTEADETRRQDSRYDWGRHGWFVPRRPGIGLPLMSTRTSLPLY